MYCKFTVFFPYSENVLQIYSTCSVFRKCTVNLQELFRWITFTILRPPSLNGLTPIILYMELTHLGSKIPIYQHNFYIVSLSPNLYSFHHFSSIKIVLHQFSSKIFGYNDKIFLIASPVDKAMTNFSRIALCNFYKQKSDKNF